MQMTQQKAEVVPFTIETLRNRWKDVDVSSPTSVARCLFELVRRGVAEGAPTPSPAPENTAAPSPLHKRIEAILFADTDLNGPQAARWAVAVAKIIEVARDVAHDAHEAAPAAAPKVPEGWRWTGDTRRPKKGDHYLHHGMALEASIDHDGSEDKAQHILAPLAPAAAPKVPEEAKWLCLCGMKNTVDPCPHCGNVRGATRPAPAARPEPASREEGTGEPFFLVARDHHKPMLVFLPPGRKESVFCYVEGFTATIHAKMDEYFDAHRAAAFREGKLEAAKIADTFHVADLAAQAIRDSAGEKGGKGE